MTPERLALATACLICLRLPVAVAQIDPDDTGDGVKLGLAAEHNSGQVGTVTLFAWGSQTRVVLDVASVPSGRDEPARIRRVASCASAPPSAAARLLRLAPVHDGSSNTLAPLSPARLLAGNYVVEVFARANSRLRVSCGELHR